MEEYNIELQWADIKEIRERVLLRHKEARNAVYELLGDAGLEASAILLEKFDAVFSEFYEKEESIYLEEIRYDLEKRIGIHKKHIGSGEYATLNINVRVRNKIERIIYDFYFVNNIRAEYEKWLRIGGKLFFPDFFLPEFGIFHKHFNPDDKKYPHKKELTLQQLEELPIVFTDANDEKDIGKAIWSKLREKGF